MHSKKGKIHKIPIPMFLFRSSVFLYILTVFTLVNSKWTKISISDVLLHQDLTETGYKNTYKSYKNVKAIQVTVKDNSKTVGIISYGNEAHERVKTDFRVVEIPFAVSSKPIYCFFKSYLHLLKLF